MSAITITLLSLARGKHIIVSDKMFLNTRDFCRDDLPALGVEVSVVDFLDLKQVKAAFRANTCAVLFEEWTNPRHGLERLSYVFGKSGRKILDMVPFRQ
jgi:cystathionine beta-lyase/cystathionine gamma-synthase